ncbi:Oidioi.mRNA.OKI2018_I69.XSR.g16944.t1.cds [Oikopleura dioica]|uniref:Oidioi.mRNA.OKI2018_I69.XSR.g16944.t1.cds n=1 Tax=Oikopleura dioica TaxID=34765 RepID=A0ABN7SI71_OIKDI|nr:Oidioi.mRNA.OKI2018_I69.XSR.g16944.t1.cds [Oikopleura dioica]
MNYNNWIGGMPDPSFLDTDSIHLDDLFIQSQALKIEAGTSKSKDDDSGISTGLNSDAGASSPESATFPDTTPLLSIKQEATESLQMGMPLPALSSPETSGQLSDSYYSNHSSSPEAERTGSKKTAYNEKWGVKVLKAWAIENGEQSDFENLPPDELNNILAKFWSEVRKSNGDYYGRNSLFNLRAMINKHLKGKPYCVPFDIVTDERFRTSNERLEKQLKLLKGIGRTITHKQPISIGDLRRMYDSGVLGTSNPLSLLRKVWFEITLHFCHKGSESQEKLLKSSFEIYRDASGRAYVSRGRPHQNRGEIDDVRMYETGGDLCPVKSYQLYLMKLHPLQPRLFQQPRRKATPTRPCAAAKLSKRYTNHCVRTTALEQFSTSRRVRPAQSSSVGSSPNSSPKISSPEQSPNSRTSPTVSQSPQMSPRQSLQLKAAQQAAQYQQSLQAYAQNQIMEHSLNQMKQNISQLNSFLAPQSASSHSINPLSSIGSDPLYDAPPATPVYHADDEAAPSPTGASSPNSRASSEHRDSICKISSEDLLNFQASAEAQALMLQSLNSLQPQDIQERIQAMGSLFGLDSDPFAINLKHISSLSGLGSGSPVSC